MSRYWRLLLPAYLFTWPVFIVTYAWALLVHFIDSINNNSGDWLKRVIVISALHLGVYLLLFFAKNLYLDWVKPRYVPVLLLISLMAVAISRGYLMENWLYGWNITESLDLGFRMRTSLLNTATSFSAAIIATANTRRHHMAKARLISESARLENLKANALASVESFDRDTVLSIKNELFTYASKMQDQSTQQVLVILKAMIDQIVQPISRRLDKDFTPWSPPEVRQIDLKINWAQAFKEGLNPGKINYALVPALMIGVVMPTVLQRTPFVEAIIGFGFTYLVGLFIGKFFTRIFKNTNPSIAIYLLVSISTGFAMGLSSLPVTSNYESQFGLLVLATVFYPLTASIISLLVNADEQHLASTRDLEIMTSELEWHLARVREIHHRNQRSLSRTLHGNIQAKLASTYLQLEKLNNQDDLSNQKLKKLVEEIQNSIQSLQIESNKAESLLEVIDKVRENWASIAQINFTISQENLHKINQDPLCLVALLDVIPELVFNAIKHGHASQISISIQFTSDRIVQLVVADNGQGMLFEDKIGLGTKILNESAIKWKRERRESLTLTTADFAFSLEDHT